MLQASSLQMGSSLANAQKHHFSICCVDVRRRFSTKVQGESWGLSSHPSLLPQAFCGNWGASCSFRGIPQHLAKEEKEEKFTGETERVHRSHFQFSKTHQTLQEPLETSFESKI
jgi:hypothetical protein